MIFVPLPLFAALCLGIALVVLLRHADFAVRANRILIALVGLYALQSLLLTLRWGYGIEQIAPLIAFAAPVLPALAYAAYLAMMQRRTTRVGYGLCGVVLLNWCALAVARDIADVSILLTYLGIGGLILFHAFSRRNDMALVRLERAQAAWVAMALTGAALVASGLVDVFIIVDFIRTGGANIGLAITLMQTAFLLCIGLAAFFTTGSAVAGEQADDTLHTVTEADDEIMDRLRRLFVVDHLHQDTDLNLRRLSRKLGLPDRAVSQAINRTQGQSVSQFVNGFRIADACKMLRTTDHSVLQISLAAGFMTKSNFNREFVRVTGQTPSAWRTANRPS